MSVSFSKSKLCEAYASKTKIATPLPSPTRFVPACRNTNTEDQSRLSHPCPPTQAGLTHELPTRRFAKSGLNGVNDTASLPDCEILFGLLRFGKQISSDQESQADRFANFLVSPRFRPPFGAFRWFPACLAWFVEIFARRLTGETRPHRLAITPTISALTDS